MGYAFGVGAEGEGRGYGRCLPNTRNMSNNRSISAVVL